MHRLDDLAAGIEGAENGTVEIYKRGTSTFATLYADYDGSGTQTPTAGLTLDAKGAIERYVNEAVRVVVKSSAGTILRDHVMMDAAPVVEVRSQSFTGIDYTTGASAAANPTNLQTVLDLWKTSAGAIDFKVLVSGVSKTLQTALAGLTGLFFNVKDPTYGATGDGSTDDTSAVSAAIAAAVAAGGGIVFFPAGTYRLTSALSLGSNVTLLGTGPASILKMDHASNHLISDSTGDFALHNLVFTTAQANSGALVLLSGSTNVIVSGCSFTKFTGSSGRGVWVNAAAANMVLTGCSFSCTAASTAIHLQSGFLRLVGSTVTIPSSITQDRDGSGTFEHLVMVGGEIIGCLFNGAAFAAGTAECISANVTRIVGCNFTNPAGGTLSPWKAIPNTPGFAASGNTFGTTVSLVGTQPTVTESKATHEGAEESTRDGRRYYVLDNSAAIGVDPNFYATIEIERTNTTVQTITVTAPGRTGLYCSITIQNNQGVASGNISFSGVLSPTGTFTVNANKITTYHFKSIASGTALRWSQINNEANVGP
jgi:hypothetical protein